MPLPRTPARSPGLVSNLPCRSPDTPGRAWRPSCTVLSTTPSCPRPRLEQFPGHGPVPSRRPVGLRADRAAMVLDRVGLASGPIRPDADDPPCGMRRERRRRRRSAGRDRGGSRARSPCPDDARRPRPAFRIGFAPLDGTAVRALQGGRGACWRTGGTRRSTATDMVIHRRCGVTSLHGAGPDGEPPDDPARTPGMAACRNSLSIVEDHGPS